CERPSKSSARVFLPSSVSNSYSFSTGTQGRSRRLLVISSFRSACSASSLASSSRATCHSSRVPMLCSGISSPSSPTPLLPREPIPSSDRTLPGSRNETRRDPETHRWRTDPLVWDRGLVGSLFDVHYVWELFLPPAKRRWGWHVLPISFRDCFVGRIEPRIYRADARVH